MLNAHLKEASVQEGDVKVSLTREVLENRSLGGYLFQVSVKRPVSESNPNTLGVADVRSEFKPQTKGRYTVEKQIHDLGYALALYLCDKYSDNLDPDQCAKDAYKAFRELCKKISKENNLKLVKNTQQLG